VHSCKKRFFKTFALIHVIVVMMASDDKFVLVMKNPRGSKKIHFTVTGKGRKALSEASPILDSYSQKPPSFYEKQKKPPQGVVPPLVRYFEGAKSNLDPMPNTLQMSVFVDDALQAPSVPEMKAFQLEGWGVRLEGTPEQLAQALRLFKESPGGAHVWR
jgi:hypothetical protein